MLPELPKHVTEGEFFFYRWKNAGLDIPWQPLVYLDELKYGRTTKKKDKDQQPFNFYRFDTKKQLWDFVTQRYGTALCAVTPDQYKSWKSYDWDAKRSGNKEQ